MLIRPRDSSPACIHTPDTGIVLPSASHPTASPVRLPPPTRAVGYGLVSSEALATELDQKWGTEQVSKNDQTHYEIIALNRVIERTFCR